MALIQIRNLVKTFGTHTVLQGVDMEVQKGDMKVVMGPSGCGKSTLLRCLNRLVEPTSGEIHFRGENIVGPNVDLRELRQNIGFVFQQFCPVPTFDSFGQCFAGIAKAPQTQKGGSE